MARKKPLVEQTQVPCGCCKGTGRMNLSRQHERTLHLLRENEPATGAALARLDGCKGEAMNMRLVRLMQYGLVEVVERSGRQVFYRATIRKAGGT